MNLACQNQALRIAMVFVTALRSLIENAMAHKADAEDIPPVRAFRLCGHFS
jgi:hypothetical protein